MNPEIGSHFCHSQTDRRGIIAQTFQTKSQLMPYFIRNDLIIRILQHISDFHTLGPFIKRVQFSPHITDDSCFLSVRRQRCLQLPEQRTFSASAFPAQYNEAPVLHFHIDILQRPLSALRITETELLCFNAIHLSIPPFWRMT